MLTQWTAGGFSPDLFWEQNLATFNAAMIGAVKRTNTLHQIAIAGAYAGECFAREKRLKKLAAYLPAPVLTAEEEQAERAAGAAKVLALFRRKARDTAKQKDKENG